MNCYIYCKKGHGKLNIYTIFASDSHNSKDILNLKKGNRDPELNKVNLSVYLIVRACDSMRFILTEAWLAWIPIMNHYHGS